MAPALLHVLNGHMWLVATIWDGTDTEHTSTRQFCSKASKGHSPVCIYYPDVWMSQYPWGLLPVNGRQEFLKSLVLQGQILSLVGSSTWFFRWSPVGPGSEYPQGNMLFGIPFIDLSFFLSCLPYFLMMFPEITAWVTTCIQALVLWSAFGGALTVTPSDL